MGLRIFDEVAQTRKLAAVILKTRGRKAVAFGQLLFESIEGGKCAFLDGDGGNEDDELGEPVLLVQFVEGAEVDQSLASSRFHLDADVVFGAELRILHGDAVPDKNLALVRLDHLRGQVRDVGLDAEEVGVVERILDLALEDVGRRVDRTALVVQVFKKGRHDMGGSAGWKKCDLNAPKRFVMGYNVGRAEAGVLLGAK